jgi:hypothetical protein
VNRSTNQVFPPPADDEWYARFVALPLSPDLAHSTRATLFSHPVQVSLYLPTGSGQAVDTELVQDLTYRFVTQHPPLLFASRIASGQTPDDALGQRFADATALLLEGPMMTTVAAVEDMNLRLLPTALSTSAPSRDLRSCQATGDVSLTNVFIEISVLDATGWEQIEHREPDAAILRAIWLVRDDTRYAMTLFSGIGGDAAHPVGPVDVRYDDAAGAFQMRADPSASWQRLDDAHDGVARPFYKALALVRSLSPRWKMSVSPQLSIRHEDGSVASLAALEWALGEIRTLRSLGGAVGAYCALRQWDDDGPFYGDVGPASPVRRGPVHVEGAPYPTVEPAALLAIARDEIGPPDELPRPVPLTSG